MSEKIKWTPELLAEVRNEKGVVFGMMGEYARYAIAMCIENTETFNGKGWIKADRGFIPNVKSYRLRPDWTPPELQEKPWVDVPVFVNERNLLMFKSPISKTKPQVADGTLPPVVGQFISSECLGNFYVNAPSGDVVAMTPRRKLAQAIADAMNRSKGRTAKLLRCGWAVGRDEMLYPPNPKRTGREA